MATMTQVPPTLDGPAILATLRESGVTAKQLASSSRLSYAYVQRILHGHRRAGYLASARLRLGLRALDLTVPMERTEVLRAS